jgi:hypothetical protein
MKITKHAQERIQQRGFQEGVVEFILSYGVPVSKQGGTTEYVIPKKVKARLISELKEFIHRIERSSKKAVLVDESTNTIITAYNIH